MFGAARAASRGGVRLSGGALSGARLSGLARASGARPLSSLVVGRGAVLRGSLVVVRRSPGLRRLSEKVTKTEAAGSPAGSRYFTRKNLIIYGGAAAAVGVVYYTVSETIGLVSSVMNVPPTRMVKYGFYAGSLTAAGLCIVCVTGVAAMTMRPEPAYRRALAMIRANEAVDKRMGLVKAGRLRAYTLNHGHLENFSVWKPPRAQLMFSLIGERYDGVATLECVKRGFLGTYHFTYVGVDVKSGGADDERITVQGSERDMQEKTDSIREFVSFKETHFTKTP